jgi:hypothetical protein
MTSISSRNDDEVGLESSARRQDPGEKLGESSSSAQGENIKEGRRRTGYRIEGGEGIEIEGSNYTRSINGGSTAASSDFALRCPGDYLLRDLGLKEEGRLGSKGGTRLGRSRLERIEGEWGVDGSCAGGNRGRLGGRRKI